MKIRNVGDAKRYERMLSRGIFKDASIYINDHDEGIKAEKICTRAMVKYGTNPKRFQSHK